MHYESMQHVLEIYNSFCAHYNEFKILKWYTKPTYFRGWKSTKNRLIFIQSWWFQPSPFNQFSKWKNFSWHICTSLFLTRASAIHLLWKQKWLLKRLWLSNSARNWIMALNCWNLSLDWWSFCSPQLQQAGSNKFSMHCKLSIWLFHPFLRMWKLEAKPFYNWINACFFRCAL